ncbi:MAG TPA: hypothetical protein PKV67_00075 [Hyphomonas sp.]|nr:hypothetical protein [Hyphomonas sp.]HRK66002.1 hypothetical protein [Hyphomonas sp.]
MTLYLIPRSKSGSCFHAAETQEQLAPVRGNVFKCHLVKLSQKSAKPRAKQVAQFADTDQGTSIGIGIKTLDKLKIAFGMANDLSDDDFARRHCQPDTAGAAPVVFKIAKLTELAGRFEQMGFGNSVSARNVFHADKPIGVKRAEHQSPERIIGICCKLNWYLPASSARMRRMDRRFILPDRTRRLSGILNTCFIGRRQIPEKHR